MKIGGGIEGGFVSFDLWGRMDKTDTKVRIEWRKAEVPVEKATIWKVYKGVQTRSGETGVGGGDGLGGGS
jgi:hypothetical protein